MKLTDRWYSTRLKQEVGIARWGHFGTPVLIFPTAGGDCEEIERAEFHTLLEKALAHEANFHALPADASPQRVLDIIQPRTAA